MPSASMLTRDRIVIKNVEPELEGGRFPIKRVVDEPLVVEADIFAEDRKSFSAVLKYRRAEDTVWSEVLMRSIGNDRWQARMEIKSPGLYYYTLEAWLDLVRQEKSGTMIRCSDRVFSCSYRKELPLIVDPVQARFSAWYEIFPRSCSSITGQHGTLKNLEEQLENLAGMGFDVIYMPPIHPIGVTARKGRNNRLIAKPGEPGSPWAVGIMPEGGHKAVHPQLGNIEDFRHLLSHARKLRLELALDIALQCSPDHPYVQEHPEWFYHTEDGAFQCGSDCQNQYEDVYLFDFFNSNCDNLWKELKSIFEFWIEQGVRIFRVDNPHTKPFSFWEWLLMSLKTRHPELIFLSEGLTRPKLMHQLAMIGFTQSYDYFPWRNTKIELESYYNWLNQSGCREYFRPVLWTNTAQCLPYYLQRGGPPAFITRLVLAATLGASYGVYGPAFELCVCSAQEPGTEVYADSEQYEIKHWNRDSGNNINWALKRINHIRKQNPALHSNQSLQFHPIDNDYLIAYSKSTIDMSNVILTIVNLDPHSVQRGWVTLILERLGLAPEHRFLVDDLFNEAQYWWEGARNFVELGGDRPQAHVFKVVRGSSF